MLKSVRHGSKLTAKEASTACKTSRLNYLAFERGRYNITRERMDKMTRFILKAASNKDKDEEARLFRDAVSILGPVAGKQ